jgi:hypothetical protein
MTATPVRYITLDWDGAKDCINAGEYEPYDRWDMSGYLVDTITNQIVFCDRMEPEDACLGRDLDPLVTLLNGLALGLAEARGGW